MCRSTCKVSIAQDVGCSSQHEFFCVKNFASPNLSILAVDEALELGFPSTQGHSQQAYCWSRTKTILGNWDWERCSYMAHKTYEAQTLFWLCISILPPRSSIICQMMESPRPIREESEFSWRKAVKAWLLTKSSDMPSPHCWVCKHERPRSKILWSPFGWI